MIGSVTSIMHLMEGENVARTITIKNIDGYYFVFDSKYLSKLCITVKNMNMDDLNALVTKPYDSYILIGAKTVLNNGKEQEYDIPPKIFKRVNIEDDGRKVDITFYEKVEND